MRALWGVGAAVSLTASLLTEASAQTPDSAPPPAWERRPSQADLNNVFPSKALRLDTDGYAILSCLVGDDFLLKDCTIEEEQPANAEFGRAALRLARKFKLAAPVPGKIGDPRGARISVPIRFSRR
jgi:TonB family protein